MANYDASIRVSTKVDSSELEKVAKAFNDIEHKSDDATDSVEEFDKASSNVDADTYKEQAKALEKVNSELDKSVEKKKESQIWSKEEEARIDSIIAKMKEKQDIESQDVSAGEARTVDFDWQKNAEETAQISASVEEISAEMDKANEKIAASDEHMNQLRVDVEEYANTLKELEGEGKYFGDNDYDQVYLAWKNAVDAVKEYESNLNKLTAKGMAEQEAKLREQEAEEQRLQNIRENAEVSDQKMVDLLEEQARLQKRIADLKKAGLTAGYKDYDNATTELQRVQEQIRKRKYGSGQTPYTAEGFRKVASAARASFNALVTGSRRANGPLTKIHNRLSSIAMSALLFNQVSRGINAAMNGAKEGFQNLAKYSDETNKTMSEFKGTLATTKNSLAVAFEPVVTTAVPYLIQLLDVLNAACDSFARFIAICSADYTYVRAKKQMVDYADSINSASKAANNALASFDELNTLSQSASGSGSNAGDMFEEVETGVPSDWTAGMIDAINNGDWNKAGTLLAEKINEAADQIDYYEIGSKIGKGLNSAFAAGNGFLTTIDTKSIGEGFATMLNTAIKTLDGKLVGNAAAQFFNRIFDAAFGFLSTFDFIKGGEKLGEVVKAFFRNIDLKEAGQDVSMLALGILHYIDAAIDEVDWDEVGERVGEFFTSIEWKEILDATGELIWDAIKAAIKAYGGMFDAAPIETAILTAIGILKFTRLGGVLGNVLAAGISAASFPVPGMKTIALAFAAAFLTALGGLKLGKYIGAKLFPEDADYYNQDLLTFLENLIGAMNMEDAKGAWREFSKELIANTKEDLSNLFHDFADMPLEILSNLWGGSDDVFGLKDALELIGNGCISVWEQAIGTANSTSELFTKLLHNIEGDTNTSKAIITGGLTVIQQATDDTCEELEDTWGNTGISSEVDILTADIQQSFEDTYDNVKTKTQEMLDDLKKMFEEYSPAISGVAIGGAAFVGQVPHLATGGVATSSVLANIGEAGREVVLPLENNTEWMDMLADRIGADRPISITFEGDLAQLGRVLKPVLDKENRRVGRSFLIN